MKQCVGSAGTLLQKLRRLPQKAEVQVHPEAVGGGHEHEALSSPKRHHMDTCLYATLFGTSPHAGSQPEPWTQTPWSWDPGRDTRALGDLGQGQLAFLESGSSSAHWNRAAPHPRTVALAIKWDGAGKPWSRGPSTRRPRTTSPSPP